MKFSLLFLAIFFSIILYANSDESDGIVSLTLRDGGAGCACHNIEPNDSVHVWVEGPDSVIIGDTVNFKLRMTGGAAVKGGFDLAVFFGELESVDSLTHIESGELTHSFPNDFVNDTVSWDFKFIAPDSLVTDTIYAVGNSVNGDGIPIGGFDKWNFSENFPVRIVDIPVSVDDDFIASNFSLSQNYPNPFNPGTKIQFTISSKQFISLKIYDVLGNEIATLVNEEKPIGSYTVKFDAGNLSSGIYLYQVKAGNPDSNSGQGFVQTKKMILLK